MHLPTELGLSRLRGSNDEFVELFAHGSLLVEMYKPDQVDQQIPHMRDEIYVVISGTGEFEKGSKKVAFKPGDFIFVPAGIEHRFVNFTNDFTTWVFFYGPEGGEATKP